MLQSSTLDEMDSMHPISTALLMLFAALAMIFSINLLKSFQLNVVMIGSGSLSRDIHRNSFVALTVLITI